MALINCPECGTKVSDRAEKCPKYACPINNKFVDPVEPKKQAHFFKP